MSKTVIRISAFVITVAAWALLGVTLHGNFGPRIDLGEYAASGKLMAQQALALLDSGGQIAIIARDTSTFSNPASDIQLASFLKTAGQAHAAIGSIRRLQVDPLRAIAVPSSDFRELIENTPQGSVIVSFMGPPVLTEAERKHLGEIQPAIVAFCSGRQPELMDMPSLFQQGLLKAAVVDRCATGTADQADRPDSAFQTLTAANFPNLSANQGAKR